MNITIKPFAQEYTKKCVDLLQYLWKAEKEERLKQFEWKYINNPNVDGKPLAIIAVDDNDQVIGFRGFYILSFFINGIQYNFALLSDTVVSPDVRRQGLFKKMTETSLKYLADNDIFVILNLTPSYSTYYGYKQLGFDDLGDFQSIYKFCLLPLLKMQILKEKRCAPEKTYHLVTEKGIRYNFSRTISNEIISKISENHFKDKIVSSKDKLQISWKTKHPKNRYVYAYALNDNDRLIAFFWFKSDDWYVFNVGLHYINNMAVASNLLNLFYKHYNPAVIAAWSFALSPPEANQLRKLGFCKIPFLNKVRKNPPIMVRTLKKNSQGLLNWCFAGLNIKSLNNWVINKFDGDSF